MLDGPNNKAEKKEVDSFYSLHFKRMVLLSYEESK